MIYQNFLAEAKKDGMTTVTVATVVQNDRQEVLLLEDCFTTNASYKFPCAVLKKGEGIGQAIQRGLMEETTMELKEIKGYLGHRDSGKRRCYYFVVAVCDPYAIESQTRFIYRWVDPREGVGYPIADETREIIDLYMRFCGQM